jgi:hypothetical protein
LNDHIVETTFLEALLILKDLLEEITIDEEHGITQPGHYIFEFFSKANIKIETKDEICMIIEAAIALLVTGNNLFE